ncbi:hypothetical protein GCM10007350_24950 [Jeongeupia chitinilytica]|uniref:Pesticidal crystal protein Cry22Aa Ig-like domain-containing protein n=1 Tax=Jeongeupia chitinilytica TaxID=1041641 RepID=A0ABQ3H293_9NEIS|nr:hypothetical protein GCM10007350_24950 [Jeongeupia chitinilytica]
MQDPAFDGVDNHSPVLHSAKGWRDGNTIYLPVGSTFDPALTAWDVDEGDLTGKIQLVSSNLNTAVPGSYSVKYSVTDGWVSTVVGGGYPTTMTLTAQVYDPQQGLPSQTLAVDRLWNAETQGSGSAYVNAGQSVSRAIRVDSAALPFPTQSVNVTGVTVKETMWGGSSRSFYLQVTDKASNAVVYGAATTLNSGTTLTLSNPLTLQPDHDYVFTIRYDAGNRQGFALVNGSADLWLQLAGTEMQPVDPYAEIVAPASNRLAYDIGYAANSPKAKLLSTSGSETLVVNKRAGAPALYYTVADSSVASLALASAANTDQLTLSGLKAGETNLLVWANGQVVDSVRLIVTRPKTITLSYSYIAFPNEQYTHLQADGAAIQSQISRNYVPYNITVNWVNNGQLTYDWDSNGDGDSAVPAADQSAAFNNGVIPNQGSVFSNVFVERRYKTTKGCASTSSGSSIKNGAGDAPPRAAFRSACTTSAPYDSAMTLTHEVGHNLGLSHYAGSDPNAPGTYMTVGTRLDPGFFAFQWRTIHDTLEARHAAGDAGVGVQ